MANQRRKMLAAGQPVPVTWQAPPRAAGWQHVPLLVVHRRPNRLGSGDVATGFVTVQRGATTYQRRAWPNALERGEHGTAGYASGCRCRRCKAARLRSNQNERNVALAVLKGREAVWKVDTGPAWRHVIRLREACWPVHRIASEAGVCEATVWRLGRAGKCWNLVADAVLRLEP